MSREILFRGFHECENGTEQIQIDGRVIKGRWVEGDFCRPGSIVFETIGYDEVLKRDNVPIWNYYAVIPETVGQYTGLTDKNGKKIFEGDVLKIARKHDGTGTYYIPPLDYPVNVVVKWDMCAWMWETLCEDKRYIGFPDAWCFFECEVIGTIFDKEGV